MQALLIMEHTLMASTVSPFRFEEFAKDIYREISNAHRQPFLLPALYGGEFSEELYEALFVLEAPSVSFTEARWKQCNTAEDAIRNHRRIFLDWAYSGKQAHLFNLFMTSSTDFYRRFYVTDVWKDAAFRERIGDSKYREYWRSKLAVELQHVRTRRVIFVGREAALAGRPLIKNRLIHEIPFPSHRISDEQFKRYVDILAQELGIRPGPRPLWRLRRGDVGGTQPPDDTTRRGDVGGTQPPADPTSPRDALWREVFSAATPLKAAEVLAAHPDAAARTARLLAEPTTRRVVAIANAMYNPCRPKYLPATGRAEKAWAILLSRQDTPYMRAGTQWERLVTALDPIPDWAANRLRNIDMMALGSVAQALIRGPYRRA